MPSHGVPPPPYFHHSPLHVLTARSIEPSSRPSDGSPGTTNQRQACLPDVRVVGGEIAAHAVLAAAVADQHLALDDARRAGDGVVAADRRGLHGPVDVAGLRVQRHEPAVEQADVDAALVERDAAIHGPAAGARAALGEATFHQRGIPSPLQRAGAHVDGEDDAPRGGAVEHAVVHQWGRLDLALRADFDRPGQPEAVDVGSDRCW